MPETFSTRQAAVIASATKIIFWQFKITDNLDNEHYWSTGTCPSVGTETINSGATEAPGAYTSGEWNRAHTFKIVNFSGVTLRRNKTESGIHAPNDVNFTIVNSSNAYTASNFVGGAVRIGLVIDDGNGRELCGSWRFVIKSASPYNQQIDVVCEDFLQQYLKGSYPNTQLINEIFPNTYDANKTGDSICVPEPYGTCYIPLRPVYATDGRYYLLGDTTNTYTITKVRSPRSLGTKVEWDSGSFAFTQSTKADAGANNWRVFQPIIADSNLDGTVDANGVWLNGSGLVDMPVKFSRSDTASITSPADIIRYVLRNMGILDYDLDLASFDTAKTTYTSWGLTWNFAFWYKQDRKKVLANLLAMCHSCLIVGEKIRLQVLSKTSQSTIDETNVLASSETGPPQFQYTDSLAEVNSDSGYVAWQQTGESQDEFLRALVPAKSATDVIDQEVLQVSAVQDSQQIQKLGTLYYQRKFLKSADISTSVKGLILAIRPDDVATVDNSDYFGGTYNVLVDEVSITPDAAVKLRCIKFSETLDDWEDLAPSAITVGTDAPSSPGSYSPVIAGPDAPGATNLPNALPGRLRVGQTTNYILLEPLASSTRISLYSADVERMRFGNLNGYLDYVTNLYGIAIGDASNYLKYDSTNGLRISGAISAGTIDIGGADASSFHVDANGNMWLGASTFDIATNPFAVSNAGVMRAVSGTIGGFTLASTTLTGTNLTLDAGNQKITVGSGTDIAILDAADATYRLAIGHSTYASASFRVTKSGALTASSATITGSITATLGAIANFTIAADSLTSTLIGFHSAGYIEGAELLLGHATLYALAKIGLKADGSGKLASGNISWDASGNITSAGAWTSTHTITGGTIQTAAAGARAVLSSTGLVIYDATTQRAKIGSDGAGWLGASNIFAWDSTGVTTMAGFTVSSTTIADSTNIVIDQANKIISLKSSTFGNQGIQFDYNAGTPRTYVGDGASNYYKFDGTKFEASGLIKGSYLYGSSLMTKGTYLTTSCLAADATLNVGDTTDFAASGSASFIDSANDRDAFTYTGKTATTLTGCSGELAHTVSATNKPLVVPAVKGMYISDAVNEMRFFGDRGDGTIEELVSIGINAGTSPVDYYIGSFGTPNSTHVALALYGSGNVPGLIYSELTGIGGSNAYAGMFITHVTGTGPASSKSLSFSAYSSLTSGTVNTIYGFEGSSLRGSNGDGSTSCSMVMGGSLQYGHGSYIASGATTAAYGIYLSPQCSSGTITTLYDLYISATSGAGTVTNHFAIAQISTTAINSFAGYTLAKGGIRIGLTATDPADGNLYVEGTSDFAGISTFINSGLHILDTNASHDLIITPGSDLSADRILTLTTGDAARTLTLSGNPTLDDWFDQSVKQAASPTFAGLTLASYAVGTWTTPTFAAGDFTASGSMTWTVAAGDVTTYAYTIINKMMTVSFEIATSTVGGTLSWGLYLAIPASKTATKKMMTVCYCVDNGTERQGFCRVDAAGTKIVFILEGAWNWAASTDSTKVSGQITFEIN